MDKSSIDCADDSFSFYEVENSIRYDFLRNPVSEENWDFTHSIGLIKEIFKNRMVPLSVHGIDKGTKILTKTGIN